MTIVQVSYFVAVCRTKSICKASEVCFVTQPAISLAIKSLEKEFGVILFYRRGNRLTLTREGEKFYGRATKLLDLSGEIENEMRDARMARHPLKVGIAPLLSISHVPPLFREMKRLYPEISLELFEYGSERAHELVGCDELDFALVNMEFSDLDKFGSLLFAKDRLLLYVSRKNPLAEKGHVTFEDLRECPLALFNADSVQNKLVRSRFAAMGIHPSIVMHASQLLTIKKFLDEDMAGAFLFESLRGEMKEYAQISLEPEMEIHVGFIWKKGRYFSSDMKKLLSYLKTIHGAGM